MSLTTKQKNWILKKNKSKSTQDLAKDLNVNQAEVEEYLNTKQLVKPPKKIFYLVLLLIPVLFFSILEFSLRAIDYGKNLDAFITLSEDYENYLFVNPDLPYRYATNMITPPAVTLDAFKKEKSDSTFRVFVMGGSSTAGFPYAYNATFPRYINRKLSLLHPNVNIEVINLGITAHNSYTIADLANEVIEQNPDLVLIYAGHNEYYGILGVGSTASYGSSRRLTKIMIELNQLKIYQLVNKIISLSAKTFNDEKEKKSNETLMSKMIGENKILYESELYWQGIEQFKLNMEYFLDELKQNNLNVILGKLASNQMQKPFVSVNADKNKDAKSLYNSGIELLKQSKFVEAKKLFNLAKEHDALRFRAPEQINSIISNLGKQFSYPVIPIDSIFQAHSPNKIIGYNLMVDHLHPNIEGYNLIGESFLNEMNKQNFTPKYKSNSVNTNEIDSLMTTFFPFTKLDSVVSKMRVKKLLSSYPFVSKSINNTSQLRLKATSFIDSIAIKMLNKQISWRLGHQEVAEVFFNRKEYDNFIKEVDAIIENQPYVEVTYIFAISRLLNTQKYDEALRYLNKLNKISPNAYAYKWIGSIALNSGDYIKAIRNLNKSISLNDKDAQVYYNLSGAYFNNKNLDDAISAIQKCLSINANYPNAKQFYNSLKQLK